MGTQSKAKQLVQGVGKKATKDIPSKFKTETINKCDNNYSIYGMLKKWNLKLNINIQSKVR